MRSAFRRFLENKLTKLLRLAGLGKLRLFLRQKIFPEKKKKGSKKKQHSEEQEKELDILLIKHPSPCLGPNVNDPAL